jgi:hypothetical protein
MEYLKDLKLIMLTSVGPFKRMCPDGSLQEDGSVRTGNENNSSVRARHQDR